MRHLLVDCLHFARIREGLLDDGLVTQDWLSQQPRCTVKSGWITYDAHANANERARQQVIIAKLALHILDVIFHRIHGSTSFSALMGSLFA